MKTLLFIFLVMLTCDQIADGYRILGMFPLHGKSHWIMQEALMKALAKRGHQVDVFTHFPQKKPIPNYTDISLKGSLPQVVNNVTATEVLGFSTPSIAKLVEMAGTNICELLNHPKLQDLIKNPPQDPPYDIIILELFAAPCYLAFARHLKVPMVGTVASVFHDWLNEVSANPMGTAYVPSMFSMHNQHMNFKERLTNFLLSHYLSWQMHYYTNIQLKYVKEHFGIDVPHIKDLYSDISLYLVNSHHTLNGIRAMTTNVIEVGGLHLSDDDDPLSPEVQKWLDESKDGCIYFTFGSMVRIETFPKEIVQQFYASFEKIAPVRVLMKVAKKEDLLPGLPKNVMTQSWFPQISVLKHKNIRAFITHGGMFGTQEAIYCAVPMIGIPLFGDQRVNIKNYVNKKVAISLNSVTEVTEETLTSAINNILKDPSYRKNIQKLSKLFLDRPTSAVNTSVFWVEYVAKYGNILQSPAMRLYWWQQNLLDIYALILVVTITVLYVVLFILWKLKKLLFGSRACAKKDNAAIKSKKNK
ncbi:UDP-glucuronosyltransferase 1-9-like [Pogonomyrmex barbatus]|uniref:UDP-glucuronosyltransferase n=1 Tax=Pogonomyrmex barbatus TaxID=144034 RepID=A0A6I9VMI6_9HYME|nr:UDP-glucuronosyltransferase 1-9-like [Pogonomyrmex barbatus]XP_011629711.1 UDP-glucuronosyltransferase 1-9-like [Pogonomyrmex barbatus]XP_011629712.1 UDP-glucuronosyltransferase 1-9-like [Pogonomyrmex barbatus]